MNGDQFIDKGLKKSLYYKLIRKSVLDTGMPYCPGKHSKTVARLLLNTERMLDLWFPMNRLVTYTVGWRLTTQSWPLVCMSLPLWKSVPSCTGNWASSGTRCNKYYNINRHWNSKCAIWFGNGCWFVMIIYVNCFQKLIHLEFSEKLSVKQGIRPQFELAVWTLRFLYWLAVVAASPTNELECIYENGKHF